ncbi:ankyrin repeat domain-containing protein [Undibacterium sp. TS12]|uniref:ankyrin repeat domain-containing protein n=1 Tax=Undibacterium sp. TS12 TaxID=2908202 RepID=UPI001F4C73BE|nr:ankyrin repeat domain-containing protein [Undibacterium sp. TS12]MCH8620102.1 ankyrin repeat domain-containing protein [Undibacterium sp. TS12]
MFKNFLVALFLFAAATASFADVMSKAERQQYKAMLKAIDDNNMQAVEQLLKNKIRLGLQEDSRAAPTFITHAAMAGRTDIVLTLLNAGADIESMNGDGFTPLMCAVLMGKTETVRLLISKKADVNAVSYHADTPLSLAREASKPDAQIVQMLLKAGARS